MKFGRSEISTIGVIVLVIVVVGIYAYSTDGTKQAATGTNDAVQPATTALTAGVYTDLSGNPIDLTAYDGQVRVVNSWASWCPFCVTELPDFATVAAEYTDEGVVVIAINRKEGSGAANNYLNSIAPLEGVVLALDAADAFYKAIGGFTMPETVFYDAAGNIVVHKRGFMELGEMRIHIESALAASGPQ